MEELKEKQEQQWFKTLRANKVPDFQRLQMDFE